MNKLYVSLVFIALVACVACQRQQAKERKNAETERERQERLSAEHQAQAQQEPTQRDSTAFPDTSPQKPQVFKSQAQKFQPRRIVPMTSPIKEPPTSLEAPSENKTEKQENDRKEAVEGGEGPSRVPTPAEETSPVQAQVP
jgi:Ni/Co efflux regulator RcnB